MKFDKGVKRNVTIERFGRSAVVERIGVQAWSVYALGPDTGFGRRLLRSRGHAISAILAHFHALHARDVAEKAKADARMAELHSQIAAMHARLIPPPKVRQITKKDFVARKGQK